MDTDNTSTDHESMSKKLWKLVRIALVMAKRGFTKSKLLLDVALIIKRSHKLAGRTLHSVDVLSSSSKGAGRDYEFRCSNSPAFPFLHLPKRRKPSSKLLSSARVPPQPDEAVTMAAVQRVLEMINANENNGGPPSPYSNSKQLRITDSPFPVKESEEAAVQVNKEADEFINKFYSNLMMEKSSALDTPYHDAWAS